MHFPCPACGWFVELQAPSSEASSDGVACPGCGSRFRAAIQREEPSAKKGKDAVARQFALDHHIDVWTAGSILDGITTLEEARAKPDPRGLPPVPAAGDLLAIPYDPEFASAVKDGCLTLQQAVERGDRHALVARLAARHGLTTDLACLAADNRITIRQALQRMEAARSAPRPVAGEASFGHFAVKLAFLLGCSALAIVLTLRAVNGDAVTASTPAKPAIDVSPALPVADARSPQSALRTSTAHTIPRTDSAGQLVEVAGPDPRSVLQVFCTNGLEPETREPLGILEYDPPALGTRLGVFRSAAEPGLPLRTVKIRRDVGTGRWVVGDGRTPIPTELFDLRRTAELG